MDHCEFPYGTPPASDFSGLALLGWIVAGVMFLIILALLGGRAAGGGRDKAQDNDALAWKYAAILIFAEAAAKAELANIYKARDNLQRAIEQLLGRKELLGSELAAQLAKLSKVGDVAKPLEPAKPAPHHDAAAHATPAPQVTVNINAPAHDAHGGHSGHGGGHAPSDAKPDRSLDDRLRDVSAAAVAFAEYWRNKSTRMADLQTMRDSLTKRGSLDSDLEKIRSGTGSSKSGRGGGSSSSGTSNHRALQTS